MPSTQSASPRASLSSGGRQTAPSYLSTRSADVILSEVRPTHIKPEALKSVNIFLDEVLWLILGYARSFATDRLRMGLLKILPTGLGKDALLEAEVELRAYIERNPPMTPLQMDEPTIQKFPLQSAFELLRVKCETYSSLGDQTEDSEIESSLHSRMVQVAGDAAPKLSTAAPAALYLTAMLEFICEHVLSNVGRVVARDSSRTTAHTQDLYVALCEDESIYPLFKTMKVQDQIEQQLKTPSQRRSRSISRNDVVVDTPVPEPTSDKPFNSRQSSESAVSNGSNTLLNRTSLDKGRHKADPSQGDILTRHRRSNSLLLEKHSSAISHDTTFVDTVLAEDDSTQDFDDLMRSGTTMKVSLTPDRLKTFEAGLLACLRNVFAKEKNQRANRPGNLLSSPSRQVTSPPSSFPNGASPLGKQQTSIGRKHVESIAETSEDLFRTRASSTTSAVVPKDDKFFVNSRARSLTETRPLDKVENKGPLSSTNSNIPEAMRNMPSAAVDPSMGIPKNTQRGPARRRESLDLDDIMDGPDDDLPTPKKTPLTPKSAQATMSRAKDLMEFLSEGPPEPFMDGLPSSGPSAYDPQRLNKGRFRTIVSRLTGSTSNEKLSSRASDEGTERRPSTLSANGSSVSLRPPSLNTKRSIPNVSVVARPVPQPSSPTVPSHATELRMPKPGPRVRQASLTQRVVPPWDSRGIPKDKNEHSVPAQMSPSTLDPEKPLPDMTVSSAFKSLPANGNELPSSPTKRVASDSEPSKDLSSSVVTTDVPSSSSSLGPLSTHEIIKAEHENVISASSPSSGAVRRSPSSILSTPAEELIHDIRRLMSRATSVEECRVLMELFLAKCGAPLRDEHPALGPTTTSTQSPIPEHDILHEANLIAVLLGDGTTMASLVEASHT